MAALKAGEMRCASCHRSTPVAPFCTHCGAPLPEGAQPRPRGLDRDELEEKARERRAGGPFRRGEYVAGGAAAGYERFAPEPEDRLARAEDADEPEPRIDRLADRPPARVPEWREATPAPPPPPPQQWDEPLRHPEERQAAYDEPQPAEVPPAYAPEAYPYAYPGDDVSGEERRGGIGPLILAAFAAVGVLAVLGGALLAGMFAPGAPVAESTPTPTAAVTSTPPPAETAEPTAPGATDAPISSPGASPGEPFTFADGATYEAIPCAAEPQSDGQGSGECPDDGSTISPGDSVWILVTFTNVVVDDVIALQVTDPNGTERDEGSWSATGRGRGWAYFSVVSSRSEPGIYEALITRNGQPAAETRFTVEG